MRRTLSLSPSTAILCIGLLGSVEVHGQKVTLGSGGAFDLGESIARLSKQISASLSKRHQGRIMILPLRERDEPATELGALLADELERKLGDDGTLDVVARTDVDEQFGRLTSNAIGLIDSKLAKRIGSVVGVDAIVTGTVAILTSEVVIHCRIVDTATGKTVGIGQTRAVRDRDVAEDLERLLEHSLQPSVIQVR
jgi:TolB-like protein